MGEAAVYNVIGMDVGGTQFRVGLFDHQGRRLLLSEGETQRSGGREWMLNQLRECALAFKEQSDFPVKACGISFGGPVDFRRQLVTSLHVPGWASFALGQWGEETLELPCRVDNDANAGAWGEYRFGAGRGVDSMVYITISTGIGGGFVCHGKLFRGKDGMAGEVGHIPVSDSGVVCSCGARGCLEVFCSGSAIAQQGTEWAMRRPEAVARMAELSGGSAEHITAKAVVQAAADGDMAASHIMREAGRSLGKALLTIIRVLNPDKIILGGGVAQAGNILLDPVRETLAELASPTITYSTEIALAELGPYSPLYGAAAMALDASESAA